MKRDGKFICDKCKEDFNRRDIKRINGNWICINCVRKKRKEKRDYLLHDVAGVRRKADLIKEWALKRKEKKKLKKRKFISTTEPNSPPKIKGEKKIIISKQLHLYLTKEEKDVLYKKFVSSGMSSQDASEKVKYISQKMNELAKKIRIEAKTKKLTEEKMNQKFLEGLARYSMEEKE